jgi:hypothetical protein
MEAEGRGSELLAAWNLSGWLATAPAAGDCRDDFWRAGQLCGWAGSSTGDRDVAMQDETVSLPRRVIFLSSYVVDRWMIDPWGFLRQGAYKMIEKHTPHRRYYQKPCQPLD